MNFTGEILIADEALKIGLVNQVVNLDTKFDLLNKSFSEAEERVQKFPIRRKRMQLNC